MQKKDQKLSWLSKTDKKVSDRMFQDKLRCDFNRPTTLDVLAQQAIVISKRSTCLFYEVGALIFHNDIVLSSGYNGAARGDVDPRDAGCARVIYGKLQEGRGACRGSHAELNAIGNLSTGTMGLDGLSMMVTLHPCNACAKQIVNKGIKKVYYIWEYGRDTYVTAYLERLGVQVINYTSEYLVAWIARNEYDPIARRVPEQK